MMNVNCLSCVFEKAAIYLCNANVYVASIKKHSFYMILRLSDTLNPSII